MKTKPSLCLMLLVISCLHALPQEYDSLVVENAQWQVIWDSDDPPWDDHMSGWLLRGDTVINGLQYKMLFERTFEEAQSNIIISEDLYGFLREDVENKKVYALESQNGGCDSSGTEYLLFDFSYEVGDTSQLCIHTEDLGTMVLEQKYTIFTFGKERNIFSFGGGSVELIEGVGHYQGLMESPVINISGGPIIYLFDYCRGTDEECNVIYVKVVENPYNNYFSIYPNPSTDELRIQISNEFCYTGNCMIRINDVFGRYVLENNDHAHDLIMDVSDFEAGMYFITLTMDGKNLAAKKLIISR